MPAGPRGLPSTQQGGGGHRPHHGGRRGGRLLVLQPRALMWRVNRRSSLVPRLRRRAWRSRSPVFRMSFLPFPLFFFLCLRRSFSFPCVAGGMGEGDVRDTPTMTAQASPGVGNGYTGGKQSPVSCLREAADSKYKIRNKTKKPWAVPKFEKP